MNKWTSAMSISVSVFAFECPHRRHPSDSTTQTRKTDILDRRATQKTLSPRAVGREGAGVGDSVVSANVTFLSSHDLRPLPLARPGQTQLADWNHTPSAEPSVYG